MLGNDNVGDIFVYAMTPCCRAVLEMFEAPGLRKGVAGFDCATEGVFNENSPSECSRPHFRQIPLASQP